MWCFVNMQLVAYWSPLNLQDCLCTLPCHAYLNRTCIILDCASCHVYVGVVYYVACFFPSCFSHQLRFRSGVVMIHLTTSVCLLHELVLVPSGISGKMTAILDLTTIIAMLVASFYRFAALPIACSSSLPILPCQPLTFVTLSSKPLLGYVTALLSPSYSVVSCR